MSDTKQIKMTISSTAYYHFKRIALGDRRSMNKMFEVMVERWPKITGTPMPALPQREAKPVPAEQDEDGNDIVPF